MIKLFFLPIALVFLLATGSTTHAQSASLNATVRPNPLEIEVIVPPDVKVGQWFDIEANISNLGDVTVSNTSALISTPSELLVRGGRKQIGNLSPGTTEIVTFRARANSSGNHLILVEVAGKLSGEDISASDTKFISADGSLAEFLRRLFFGA